MSTIRTVRKTWRGRPTRDGAGVSLTRVFGYYETRETDPFLLLDHFGSDNPKDYIAGFPWHPHRGIETITYMLEGRVRHGDSLGNSGVIEAGDVQWMTAGSGIIHEEMPEQSKGRLSGFQLWANLPSSKKMMEPRYRDILASDIPKVPTGRNASAKVIAGELEGRKGPVQDVVTDPQYLDVSIGPKGRFTCEVKEGHSCFAYIFEGNVMFGPDTPDKHDAGTLVIFSDSGFIDAYTGPSPTRFLLVSGEPLREPIAWRGPIVMNTEEELKIAFDEYHKGTFLKTQK